MGGNLLRRALAGLLSDGGPMAEKILVVDDELDVRSVLEEFFVSLDYEVMTAATGEEALKRAEREEPKVILLDVFMPGIDGLETCKTLKTSEKTRGIPVIMTTGYGIMPAQAEMVEAEDLVFKPFNLCDLLMRVKAISKVGHLTNRVERLLAYMEELDRNLAVEKEHLSRQCKGAETLPASDYPSR
jgi:CheY-like chemotaxis protein